MLLTTQKLGEKCPLKYPLVSHLSFLDPRTMEGDNASVGRLNFKKALNNLVHAHRVNEDDLICLYNQFINEALHQCSVFSNFNPYRDKLNTFLNDRMSKLEPYVKLSMLCHQLLLISHGQASIE